MIALDTNVVVRYLMQDDVDQSARAAAFIDGAADSGDTMYVPLVVLCEVAWVLRRAYRLDKADLIAALSGVLRAASFEVEAADAAYRALRRYAAGAADFADYVIVERANDAGCVGVATFDAKLLREQGAVAL